MPGKATLRFGDPDAAPEAVSSGAFGVFGAVGTVGKGTSEGGKLGGVSGGKLGGVSAFSSYNSSTPPSMKPPGSSEKPPLGVLPGFGASVSRARAATPPRRAATAVFAQNSTSAGAGAEDEDAGGDEDVDAYKVIGGKDNAPSLTTMCSHKEFSHRQEGGEGAFSEMERDAETKDYELRWRELVVSRYQYNRGGAGAEHKGSNMRTLRAIQETITHLETSWMTSAMLARAPGGYAGIYKVLHDAIKAISAEMGFLRPHYAPSLVVANVFERIIRIAVDAHYRLAEDLSVNTAGPAEWAEQWVQEHGIPDQMRKKKGIDIPRNARGGTEMGSHEDYIYKNLNTLVKDVYPQLTSRGIKIPSEAEFVAYHILKLCMRRGHAKDEQDLFHSLSHTVRNSPEISSAMTLRQAIEQDNYVAFFRGISSALNVSSYKYAHFGYLLCALAHEYFPRMRTRALEILISTRSSKNTFLEPLDSLHEQLGCDDAAHLAEVLRGKDFQVTKDTCLIVKPPSGIIPNTLELADVRKVKLISAKMPEIPGHVCGAAVTSSGLGAAQKRPAVAPRMFSEGMATRAVEGDTLRKEREAVLAAEEQRKAMAEKDRLKAQAQQQEKTRTEIKKLLEQARGAGHSCKFDEARKLLADAYKRDPGVAGAEGARELKVEIEAKEKAESERKAKEELEKRQRQLKEEEEQREHEDRGLALLVAVKKALGASVLAHRLAEHDGPGASAQLQDAIKKAMVVIEEARTKVKDARLLLPNGHREVADADRLIAAEEDLVDKAKKSVKRRELETECDQLMAQYQLQAAAAEKCLVECDVEEAMLLRDRSVLEAKALDPAMLVLEYLDQVEEVASNLHRRRAACEKLHEKLREHTRAASQVLAKVSAIPDTSVAAKGQTAAITSCAKKLDLALKKQQGLLVATKERYDAALKALVRERERRKAEEEQLMLAKMERYRKRKQRPLQPFNEDATRGWGVGVGVEKMDVVESESNKRLKESRLKESSAAVLMDDTVRRIVEAWSARRWKGEQLQRVSALLRDVAFDQMGKEPLLQTVSPSMCAQLQVSVTANLATRLGGGQDGWAEDAALIVSNALKRYLSHVTTSRASLTVMSAGGTEARRPGTGPAGGLGPAAGRATVSVVMILKCQSADDLGKAAIALGSASTPAIALALGGRGGWVGGGGYESLHGDPALAVRARVQEAVREYCLHLRRSQHGGGGSAERGRGRAVAVPMIRRVCALHPKAVDLEIGVHNAACEKERVDDTAPGGAGSVRTGGTGRGGGRVGGEEGRDLLRVALFEWVMRQLGSQHMHQPLALYNSPVGHLSDAAGAPRVGGARVSGHVSLANLRAVRGNNAVGAGVSASWGGTSAGMAAGGKMYTSDVGGGGEGEDVDGQEEAGKLSWIINDSSSVLAPAAHEGNGGQVGAVALREGSDVTCSVVEECGLGVGVRREGGRSRGVVVVLPPLTVGGGGWGGVGGCQGILHRAERELAQGVAAAGWTGAWGVRLLVVVGVPSGVVVGVGGCSVIEERLCARAVSAARGGGGQGSAAGAEGVVVDEDGEDTLLALVKVVVLDEHDVEEAMCGSALALASSFSAKLGATLYHPSHLPSHLHDATEQLQPLSLRASAAAAAHYVDMSRVWQAHAGGRGGDGVLGGGGGAADIDVPHPGDGAWRRDRALWAGLRWLAVSASMTPIVCEYAASSLVGQVWAKAVRLMPRVDNVQSHSLVEDGVRLLAACVDKVGGLLHVTAAALASNTRLHASWAQAHANNKALLAIMRSHGQGDATESSFMAPLWEAVAAAGAGGGGRRGERGGLTDDKQRTVGDVLEGAKARCLSLLNACRSHPLGAGGQGGGGGGGGLSVEVAAGNICALVRDVGEEGTLAEARVRTWCMVRQVVEYRVQQLQLLQEEALSPALLLASLDPALAEWSLEEEAAPTLETWVLDPLDIPVRARSPSPSDFAPHALAEASYSRLPTAEIQRSPSVESEYRAPARNGVFFGGRWVGMGRGASVPRSDDLIAAEGEGGEEEEEEEVFGSELAAQLRQLKAATSAARSATRAAGSGGGGGGMHEPEGEFVRELTYTDYQIEVVRQQARAKRSFAALSSISHVWGPEGGEEERPREAGQEKRQARKTKSFSIDVGRGCFSL